MQIKFTKFKSNYTVSFKLFEYIYKRFIAYYIDRITQSNKFKRSKQFVRFKSS